MAKKQRQPWENNPCGICRAYKSLKRCEGHGGGASGGNKQGAESSDSKTLSNTPPAFNPIVISTLLAEQLLDIDSNRYNGVFTIQLQCKPEHLSNEQKDELEKYIECVLNELEEFKKEHDITADCKPIFQSANGKLLSLSVKLPTELNEQFLIHLNNKNLLVTTSNVNLQDDDRPTEEKPRSLTKISPLKTRLKPSE